MYIFESNLSDPIIASIVVTVFEANPNERMNIVNSFLQPETEPVFALLNAVFATAAAEATVFMNNNPAIKRNPHESDFDILNRVYFDR